jgi:hypothetical protein
VCRGGDSERKSSHIIISEKLRNKFLSNLRFAEESLEQLNRIAAEQSLPQRRTSGNLIT